MLKLASLFAMVKSLPVVSSSFKSAPKNYANATRCREFAMALSQALAGRLWKDIKSSPFVSVLIDESTDISTSENMIIYLIYLKAGRAVATYVNLRHSNACTRGKTTSTRATQLCALAGTAPCTWTWN